MFQQALIFNNRKTYNNWTWQLIDIICTDLHIKAAAVIGIYESECYERLAYTASQLVKNKTYNEW